MIDRSMSALRSFIVISILQQEGCRKWFAVWQLSKMPQSDPALSLYKAAYFT
jgi:hypothetical protein